MIEKFQLPGNNLRVITVESKKSPVVSVQLWVRTGSVFENAKQKGFSHFIEHLLFKGTKKYKVGEVAQTVEGRGGEMNAFTTYDHTVFYINISSAEIETACDVLSQMLVCPTFDEQEIENEKEVVIEEIKRGRDEVSRVNFESLFTMAFAKTPYAHPVIGYEEIIRNCRRSELMSYFKKYYQSANTFAVVTGDFDSKKIKTLMTQYFSGMHTKKAFRLPSVREAKPNNKPRVLVKATPFLQTRLNVAWHVPGIKNKKIPILDLYATALGSGESSFMYQELKQKQELVLGCSASAFIQKSQGLFILGFVVKDGKLFELLDYLPKLLPDFTEQFDAEALERAIRFQQSDYLFGFDSVNGLGRRVGNDFHLTSDVDFTEQYIASLAKNSVSDCLSTAHQMLKSERMNISLIVPEKDHHDLAMLTKKLSQLKMSASKPKTKFKPKKIRTLVWTRPKKSSQPQLVEVKTGGHKGINYFSEQTPTVSFQIAVRGGVSIEPEQKAGLTELLSRTLLASAKNQSEQEIAARMDFLGASISAHSAKSYIGVSLDGLLPTQAEAVKVLENILMQPGFESHIIEREKSLMKQQIKLREDNPASRVFQAFVSNLFKNHPYGRDLLGSTKTLDSITREDLTRFWLNHSRDRRCTFSLAGGVKNASEFSSILKNFSATSEKPSDLNDWKPSHKSETIFLPSEKEQTHLIVGFPGLKFNDQRKRTLRVLQSILSGQGGRFFLFLRDQASLAYSVSPVSFEGEVGGYFGGYIACSPHKAQQAIDMLMTEFKKLAEIKVGDEELERSKQFLLGRYKLDLQRVGSISSALLSQLTFGGQPEEIFKMDQIINPIQASDIQLLAQDLFKQPPLVAVCGKQAIEKIPA